MSKILNKPSDRKVWVAIIAVLVFVAILMFLMFGIGGWFAPEKPPANNFSNATPHINANAQMK